MFYATGARPDLAKEMGFIGGKMPLHHGPAEGEEGLKKTLAELAQHARASRSGLLADARLLDGAGSEVRDAACDQRAWDDRGSNGSRRRCRLTTIGATPSCKQQRAARSIGHDRRARSHALGFRMLLEMECCDIIQPDVGWCGGLTELIKISATCGCLRRAGGAARIQRLQLPFRRHAPNSPFAEFLMMAPAADHVVPMFTPLLLDEPVPLNGRLVVPERPGFGVGLNPACELRRPYEH